jgi:hypothetical protein
LKLLLKSKIIHIQDYLFLPNNLRDCFYPNVIAKICIFIVLLCTFSLYYILLNSLLFLIQWVLPRNRQKISSIHHFFCKTLDSHKSY